MSTYTRAVSAPNLEFVRRKNIGSYPVTLKKDQEYKRVWRRSAKGKLSRNLAELDRLQTASWCCSGIQKAEIASLTSRSMYGNQPYVSTNRFTELIGGLEVRGAYSNRWENLTCLSKNFACRYFEFVFFKRAFMCDLKKTEVPKLVCYC